MENAGPHSARARADRIRITPRGRKLKPPAPTGHEVAILRRIARDHLLVTFVAAGADDPGGTRYTYGDGTPIRDARGRFLTGQQFARMTEEGWIVAVRGESLTEGGPAQRYVVPRP